jgi:hypothetical protein
VSQQIVVRPGQVFDLDDKFGSDPMHTAEDERRAEPAVSRRGKVERHVSRRERFEPQPPVSTSGTPWCDPCAAQLCRTGQSRLASRTEEQRRVKRFRPILPVADEHQLRDGNHTARQRVK